MAGFRSTTELFTGMASDNSKNLHDPRRLHALRRTALMDSAPEASFDRLTRLAARLLNVPVALVSLVDEQRQFFKSQSGLSEPWATRAADAALALFLPACCYDSGEPLIVNDARQHLLVEHNLAIPRPQRGCLCGHTADLARRPGAGAHFV